MSSEYASGIEKLKKPPINEQRRVMYYVQSGAGKNYVEER